jgi:hypothetical protein
MFNFEINKKVSVGFAPADAFFIIKPATSFYSTVISFFSYKKLYACNLCCTFAPLDIKYQ